MVAAVTIWLGAKVILGIVAAVLFVLIWKYLNKKSLGMQTLLDLVIKDHIRLLSMTIVVSTIPYIQVKDLHQKVGASSSHYLAMGALYAYQITIMALFVEMFVSNIIRYLAVFHQGFLNDIDDENIIRGTRIAIAMTSLTTVPLTDVGYKSVLYSHFSGIQSERITVPNSYPIKMMVALNLVSIVYTQLKIEYYKKKVDMLQPLLQRSQDDEEDIEIEEEPRWSLSTKRNIALCVLSVILVFIYTIYSHSNPEDHPTIEGTIIKGLRAITIIQVVLTIIIPLIYIKNTKKLCLYFKQSFGI